jgi:predicted acyltransferase
MQKRLYSIDTLRGFDMCFIMGFASLIAAICSYFPNSGFANGLAAQMGHADWAGLMHHDTIFPLFLFIAGITFPFSLASQKEKGKTKGQIYWKVISRCLILIALGIVYNGFFKFDFANQRYASVLGRIGIAWMIAAILYMNLKTVPRIIVASAILIGYWLLLKFVKAPDAPAGADPYSFEWNLVGWVDRQILPGRVLYDRIDPEGVLSTVPAIVTAMLGMFTGEFVRIPDEKISGNKKTVWMFIATAIMLAVGLLWSLDFPFVKKLWTSSYVLVVGAYSLGLFALLYWICDVKGKTGWTTFFRVIGMNSITIYLFQQIVPVKSISKFFLGGLQNVVSNKCINGDITASIIGWCGYIAVCWLFLYFLYKHKVFLKV